MRISIPRHCDLVARCAEVVVKQHQSEPTSKLTDVSSAIILVPESAQAARIRRCLLTAADANALIPPEIVTLKSLFHRRHQGAYFSEHAAKLLLGTELNKIIHLFHNTDCWQLTDRIIPLFNELEEREELNSAPIALADEAELLSQIYRAWKDVNAASSKPNEAACYRQALREDTLVDADKKLFLCGGLEQMSPTEIQWAERLEKENRLTIIEYDAERQPGTAKTEALSLVWHNTEKTLAQRAAECRKRLPQSPLSSELSVFKAETPEQHSVGIKLRIMDWLSEGITNIAVVTEDRKLIRRLRALLERDDIPVYYPAGWAMSTTSSATALMHLLPEETGFTPKALNRLARSPYCKHPVSKTAAAIANTQIQRALSGSPEIIETLDAAVQCILSRKTSSGMASDTVKLVEHIRDALRPLDALWRSRKEKPFQDFFEALEQVLGEFGMTQTFNADIAGQQIIGAMKEMKMLAAAGGIRGNWLLWRSLLLHTLETKHFIQPMPERGVGFYNLSHASLLKPDALILAGLDRAHTQPAARGYLLNDNSRTSLGLNTRARQLKLFTQQFQTLVEKADKALLSYQLAENNCSLTPATWLDELQSFHAIAYGDDLTEALSDKVRDAIRAGTREVESPVPIAAACPQPPAPKEFWPQPFSANSYASASQCPYQFFVKCCLKIRALQEAPDYGSRQRYGTKLHSCLTDLHRAADAAELIWKRENAAELKRLAAEIASQKFSEGADKHYNAARSRREAETAMENYVDWLMEQDVGDATFTLETKESKLLEEGFELGGRLDCVISQSDETVTIIDYKTGSLLPKSTDVQIPFYCLLRDDATKAGYLLVKGEQAAELTDRFVQQDMQTLRDEHAATLRQIKRDFEQAKPLAAIPAPQACRHCDYFGVCRISAWGEKQT